MFGRMNEERLIINGQYVSCRSDLLILIIIMGKWWQTKNAILGNLIHKIIKINFPKKRGR